MYDDLLYKLSEEELARELEELYLRDQLLKEAGILSLFRRKIPPPPLTKWQKIKELMSRIIRSRAGRVASRLAPVTPGLLALYEIERLKRQII